MAKLEKTLALLIVVSLICKIFQLPYAAVLFTIFTFILVIIYLLFGFVFFNNIQFKNLLKKEAYNGISVRRIIGSFLVGFGLSITIIGILFKFQYWGYSNPIIKFGLYLLLIILIIGSTRFLKSKDNFYIKILKRILIIGVFGLILIFV